MLPSAHHLAKLELVMYLLAEHPGELDRRAAYRSAHLRTRPNAGSAMANAASAGFTSSPITADLVSR
jgi:hypothetical protein